jgi:hypothetical protein
MKKFFVSLFVAIFLASSVFASTTIVDLGTSAGETGVVLADWGPFQPTTSGGSWGGIVGDPGSNDDSCRTVWGVSDAPWATVGFTTAIDSVTIRHLDGIANDSFNVYVDNVLWGSYANAGDAEVWKETTFSGVAGNLLRIEATGEAWALRGTYGQLGIDRLECNVVPAPGALLLAGMGTAFVGYLKRRKIVR